MNEELIHCLWLSACFLALFAIGELLYHVFKVQAEFTRKWSHIGTGILTMLFPVFFNSHWYVLIMCSSFAVLLVLSVKYGFLKSINAVERETVGSVCYPISVYIAFIAYTIKGDILTFYFPILILAIADPMAAFVGKTWTWKPYHIFGQQKSLSGSMAFAVTAFAVIFSLVFPYLVFIEFRASTLIILIGLSLWSALVEAASSKGWDNLTIPLGVLAYLLCFPF